MTTPPTPMELCQQIADKSPFRFNHKLAGGEWFTLETAHKHRPACAIRYDNTHVEAPVIDSKAAFAILTSVAAFNLSTGSCEQDTLECAIKILLLGSGKDGDLLYPIKQFTDAKGDLYDFNVVPEDVHLTADFKKVTAAMETYYSNRKLTADKNDATNGHLAQLAVFEKAVSDVLTAPVGQEEVLSKHLGWVLTRLHENQIQFALHYLRLMVSPVDTLLRYYGGKAGHNLFSRMNIPVFQADRAGLETIKIAVEACQNVIVWAHVAATLQSGATYKIYYSWFACRMEFYGLSCITALSTLNSACGGRGNQFMVAMTSDSSAPETVQIGLSCLLYAQDATDSDSLIGLAKDLFEATVKGVKIKTRDSLTGRLARCFSNTLLKWGGFFSSGIMANRVHGAIKCQQGGGWFKDIMDAPPPQSIPLEMIVGARMWQAFIRPTNIEPYTSLLEMILNTEYKPDVYAIGMGGAAALPLFAIEQKPVDSNEKKEGESDTVAAELKLRQSSHLKDLFN